MERMCVREVDHRWWKQDWEGTSLPPRVSVFPGFSSLPSAIATCSIKISVDLVCIPKLFHQLPPPLSYLCELSILPHLNELPVSLLPPRLAGLFEKWTRLVTVKIKCKSFTDYPSKAKLVSDTVEVKVEPNVFVDMVKWLVEKKVNLKPSAITIMHTYGEDKGVDFVVNDRIPTPCNLRLRTPP